MTTIDSASAQQAGSPPAPAFSGSVRPKLAELIFCQRSGKRALVNMISGIASSGTGASPVTLLRSCAVAAWTCSATTSRSSGAMRGGWPSTSA